MYEYMGWVLGNWNFAMGNSFLGDCLKVGDWYAEMG